MITHPPGDRGVAPGKLQKCLGQLQLAKGLAVEVWLVSTGLVVVEGVGTGGVREARHGGERGREGDLAHGGDNAEPFAIGRVAIGRLGEETA